MSAAHALSLSASLCFGIALVSSRIGLRTLDARSGAVISIPTATALFILAAPFALDIDGFTIPAAVVFALVGLIFPAFVTILTFRSNKDLGPTTTGAMSGTAPVFALGAASLFLGEDIPRRAVVSCAAIVVGLAILSWKQSAVRPSFTPRLLLWPISGAILRGLAQAAAKAGLALWPNPFAASLIGYFVSSATVITVNRVAHPTRPPLDRPGVAWFAATGLLNGCAVLLMYGALNIAPVSLVAPIVATYPLIAALVSAAVLREEPLTLRMLVGALTMVLAVIYLLAPGAEAKTFAPADVLQPVGCARG